MFRLFTLAAALALTGCSAVVPSTLARLETLSPLTADPAAIEVALILPPGLRVAPGSAVLTLGAARTDTGAKREARFVLEQTQGNGQALPVPDGARADLFRLAAADVPRMRAEQAAIAAWKAEAGNATEGSLGIGLGGCAVNGGPASDARAAALIRTTAGGEFLPLIRDTPLRALLGDELFNRIGPCAD